MQILFESITPEELAELIVLKLETKPESQEDHTEFISTKVVQKMLNISGPTVWRYAKQGILKSYQIGSSVRYKKTEVLEAMKQIECQRA